jgi:hypothetical protein
MYRTSNRNNYESDSDEDSFDEDEDYGHRYSCKPQWKHAEPAVAKTLKGTFTVTSGRTAFIQLCVWFTLSLRRTSLGPIVMRPQRPHYCRARRSTSKPKEEKEKWGWYR